MVHTTKLYLQHSIEYDVGGSSVSYVPRQHLKACQDEVSHQTDVLDVMKPNSAEV